MYGISSYTNIGIIYLFIYLFIYSCFHEVLFSEYTKSPFIWSFQCSDFEIPMSLEIYKFYMHSMTITNSSCNPNMKCN